MLVQGMSLPCSLFIEGGRGCLMIWPLYLKLAHSYLSSSSLYKGTTHTLVQSTGVRLVTKHTFNNLINQSTTLVSTLFKHYTAYPFNPVAFICFTTAFTFSFVICVIQPSLHFHSIFPSHCSHSQPFILPLH